MALLKVYKSKEELFNDKTLNPKNGDEVGVSYGSGDYELYVFTNEWELLSRNITTDCCIICSKYNICTKKERTYSITAICDEYSSNKIIELTEGQYKDILDRLDKLEKSVKDLDFDDSEYCHMSHELRKRVEKLEKCNRIAEVKEHIEERQRND